MKALVLAPILAVSLLSAEGASIALPASRDNALFEEFPDRSNGSGDFLFTGLTLEGNARRALIAFDIGGVVPSGSTITSVELSLSVSRAKGGDRVISLNRLTSDWGEAGSDAGDPGGKGIAALPGDATWASSFDGTDVWTSAGGDFVGAASATQMLDDAGTYTWASTPALVSDVQDWLDNPASNLGWAVLGDESEPFTAKRLNSRENSSGAPSLLIEFTPIPEPSVSLLACLGLGLCWRRKRV